MMGGRGVIFPGSYRQSREIGFQFIWFQVIRSAAKMVGYTSDRPAVTVNGFGSQAMQFQGLQQLLKEAMESLHLRSIHSKSFPKGRRRESAQRWMGFL
jgi:hypothetical protein